MGIFEKLKRVADSRGRVVAADLKRLDDIKPGTADKAVNYVLDGRDETVLATISSGGGKQLEVGEAYLHHKSPTPARRRLLAQQRPLDPEFSLRYTEVLLASCPNLPDSAAGSDKANSKVRVFFSEVFGGMRDSGYGWRPNAVKPVEKPLTLADAVRMTELLGGSIEDLVDVAYNKRSEYGVLGGSVYRSAIDMKPLFEQHPEACITAARRLSAAARAVVVKVLRNFGVTEQPLYEDLVLDMAGDSSKAVREAAGAVLTAMQSPAVEKKAIERLQKGKVAMRAGMVEYLAKIGTDSALDALRAHKAKEKTARVVAAIDTALAVSEEAVAELAANDDAKGYQSLDGERVDIPPLEALPAGEPVKFGDADRAELAQIVADENERIKERNAETKRKGYKFQAPLISTRLPSRIVDALNASEALKSNKSQTALAFLTWGVGSKWASRALARMPVTQALRISALQTNMITDAFSSWSRGAFSSCVKNFLAGPHGDLRHLERIEIAAGATVWTGWGSRRKTRKVRRGDFARSLIEDSYNYYGDQMDAVPAEKIWPYVAEHLDIVDEAFGLRPQTGDRVNKVAAIRLLRRLPATPARYFRPLLDVATGETKAGRLEARQMLRTAPNVEQHIVALLDDSRQAVRAGAAEWIAARDERDAIPALYKRLKKEKSELAQAAMLTALKRLGEDLSELFSPEILLDKAEKGLKRAKLDKLDWMALEHLPAVYYRDDSRVPGDVLKWWLFLAVKLKQPGGNALFENYLEQLRPDSAETFSTWILDSWVNYDTGRPTEEDGNAHANRGAKSHWDMMKRWYKEYTLEQAFADIKRNFMSNYLHSGAATKGLLGLASKASPTVAADRVRSYLKNHGSRTSQSSALLEMLAAAGDPVSLQVIIAAATRLKQKGVQKFAGTLVERVAEAKNWSMDELADRTIPSAGLDEDGVLELPCGPDSKPYRARVNESLVLEISNPDGKKVKSLPAAPDDTTKASKKALSESRRELKQVVAMQSARLYEALCSGRRWTLEDWLSDLHGHPVIRKLTERIVWVGLDASGEMAATFRPTAEGDYTDARDEDVDIEAFTAIRIAYGAEMPVDVGEEWAAHLTDYEIETLFTQFGRTMLTLADDAGDKVRIEDRKGWLTDTFTFRGAATKLGYERGEAMDAGYFNEYTKGFMSAGVIAVIEFSGNCLPEENVPAAMMSMSFEKYTAGRRGGTAIKLADVPPVLLSECWNDYRAMVAKAAYDEKWEQKMPWM